MNKVAAQSALENATKAHRTHKRWMDWCDGLSAAKQASGLYEKPEHDHDLACAVEREYMRINKRPSFPSKAAKYRMYGETYRAAILADVEVAPGSIQDMAGVARVIAEVTAKLATA